MKRILTLALVFSVLTMANSQIRILEIYGGGGSTATSPLPSFKNDYVVLKNIGSSSVNLSGYSIQYGSAASGVAPATWSSKGSLSGTIAAGACFIIKMSADGGTFTGADFPTANLSLDNTNTTTATGTASNGIGMSGTSGKIALVNGTTIIDNTTTVVDKIGYGTANNGEGTVVVALSTTTAARRNNDGATDTDNNLADFSIVVPNPTNCGTIPVQLLDFKAQKENKAVKLLWSTATELNNAYYTIERSENGKSFEKIGEVSGYGNSNILKNYQFMDEKPMNTVNYYRLRQVDFDGKETVYKTVSVHFGKSTTTKVYPSIAKDKVNVEISGDNGASDLLVVNLLGQVVKAQKLQNTEGVIPVNISDLPNGSYIMRIVSKNESVSQRFEKQ